MINFVIQQIVQRADLIFERERRDWDKSRDNRNRDQDRNWNQNENNQTEENDNKMIDFRERNEDNIW